MADSQANEKTVTLKDNSTGKSVTLPVNAGSIGPEVIDIRNLYAEIGMFTFDPGYGATGSCVSGLTYIDGEAGILLHRGYAIEDLAEKSDFLKLPFCCSTVTCRQLKKKLNLLLLSPAIRWRMNNCQSSCEDSGVMLTQWQFCVV